MWPLKGAGGGPNAPTKTDDNLFSVDFIEFTLGISEGPIRGFSDGLKSVKVGDTPLLAYDGTTNFSGFTVELALGVPAPAPLEYVLGGETSSINVGVTLSQNIAVTRQTSPVARGNIDVLEIRMRFAQLVISRDEGDDPGSFNNTARFQISYKPHMSSTWQNYGGLTEIQVTGKTSSGYAKEYCISVPTLLNDDWDIRVTKYNVDNSTTDICVLIWESFQMTKTTARTYPNLALFRATGQATSQFSSVPDFSAVYDGMVLSIPSNYNSDAHTYDLSTPWNGTFKTDWTNNPAWILYNLITNTRWGLAKYYPFITANRYDFYDAGRWCDEQVPNGILGTQPRYTFSDTIQDPRPGLELLQYVAGTFNATVFDDANGAVHLRVDKWAEPSILFNPESVGVAGFSYAFTDVGTRVNDITVAFINPDLDWNEDKRRVYDSAKIAAFGRIPMDFVAVGCTDVREAQRRAFYLMTTANTEVCSVTFDTNRLGSMVEPFSTMYIADPTCGWSSGGRIKSIVGNVLTLRDPIHVTTFAPLPMKLQGLNTIVALTVMPSGTGDNTVFTITSGTVPANLPAFAAFTIEEAGFLGLAKPFRVLTIAEVEGSPDHYQITGLEINRNKYYDSDHMTASASVEYSFRKPGMPLPPKGLVLESGTKHLIRSQDGTLISRIYVSWERQQRAFIDHFDIEWQMVGAAQWNMLSTKMDDIYLGPVKDGASYNLRVTAVGTMGVSADPVVYDKYLVVGKTQAPSTPAWGVVPYSLQNYGLLLNWKPHTDIDFDTFELRVGGTSWADSNFVAKLTTTSYFTTSSPAGSLTYRLRAIDTTGNYSLDVTPLVVVIPGPGTTSVSARISGQDFILSWTPVVAAFAIDYFEIRHGASWAVGTLVDKTKTVGYSQHIEYGGARNYWISAVDIAGNTGPAASVSLMVSPPIAVTLAAQVIDNNVLLNWGDATTSLPIVSYEVRKGNTWATGSSIGDNGNGRFAAFFEQASGVFTYWVRALDTAGNLSTPTSINATVSQPPDYALRLDYNLDAKGLVYDFETDGNTQGWYTQGATGVAQTQVFTVNSTGFDPMVSRTMGDFILYGCEYPLLEVKLRRVAGAGWDGPKCYYSTPGHGIMEGYRGVSTDLSPVVGESKLIQFDMNALASGGQDWNASIITSLRLDFGATASDIFEIDYIRLIPYRGLNIVADQGAVYAVLKPESWQSHFTSKGWTTPQDQINAGFPYYWSEASLTAYYEEVINYGTVLTSTAITATLTTEQTLGAVAITPTVSYKTLWTDPWTSVAGATSVVGSFQFIKIRYDFVASGVSSLLRIINSNVKLSSKTKNDGGSGTATATDSGGTVVLFNSSFTSIQGIVVTAQGTSPVIAIYDFVGVTNPTSFKVLLFNTSGTRITGPFSWTAKGV